MPENISINYISLICERMIQRLKDDGIQELKFEDIHYWNVPVDKMTSFPDNPNLTVGSLLDDIRFLNSLINEDYDTDYLELDRLASLFRFIYIRTRDKSK